MRNKVTIQDIADALGLSRNTVSKAINNSEGLSESTKEKILEKAVEMGYKQFSYVKSYGNTLSSPVDTVSYQGEIALFTTKFLNAAHFSSMMLDKFQQELSQMGYTLNTHRVLASDIEEKTLPITFLRENVKGIICFEMFDWEYSQMLCELDIPILFVDGPAKINGRNLAADQLYMDNTTEITRLVTKMLQQGITRFGFVGDYTHCQSFYERYCALYLTLSLSGIPLEDRFVIKKNEHEDITLSIKDMEDLPEVFFCANDFIALDVLKTLKEMGKKIPEDVQLCGFDDSSDSRLVTPALTTIHIHTQITALSAIHLLMTRIEEPSMDYRFAYTESDLVLRDSTTCKE